MAKLKIDVLSTYTTKNGALAYKVKVNGVEHNALTRGDSVASFIINFKSDLRDLTGRTNLTLPADKFAVGASFEHDLTATATAAARAPRATMSGHRTFASLSGDCLSVEFGAYHGRTAVVVGSSTDPDLVAAFTKVTKIKNVIAEALSAEAMVAFNDARVAVQKAESLRGVFDDKIVDDLIAKAKEKDEDNLSDLDALIKAYDDKLATAAKKATAKKATAKK